MTHPHTVANWRGQAARVQQYYEEGEKLLSKAKNLLVVTAALKILGLGWLALLILAPVVVIAHVVVGYLWVRRGWYAHATEIGVLEQWTPISRWQSWLTVLVARAVGVQFADIPTDRLPEEMTRVMASTQTKTMGKNECPCCGGTAGLMREGWRCCTLCQRGPWHDACQHCWDHCRCQPHPLWTRLDADDRLAAIRRGEVPQTDGRD